MILCLGAIKALAVTTFVNRQNKGNHNRTAKLKIKVYDMFQIKKKKRN
jgi:hypothetical protein